MRVAPTILKSHLTQIKQSSVYFDWVWCMVLKTINFPLQRMTVIYHIDINKYAEDIVVNDSSDTIHVVLTKMFSFNSLAKTVFFILTWDIYALMTAERFWKRAINFMKIRMGYMFASVAICENGEGKCTNIELICFSWAFSTAELKSWFRFSDQNFFKFCLCLNFFLTFSPEPRSLFQLNSAQNTMTNFKIFSRTH